MDNSWSFAKQAVFKIVWVLMPLIMLVLVLHIPDLGIFEQLLITFIFVGIEVYVIWKQVVPFLSELGTNIILSPMNTVDEEATVEAARVLMKEGRLSDASLLFEQFTNDCPKQLRAWILRTDFLCHDMGRYDEAVECLKKGLHSARWNRQDKAFFLYRIGKIYADHLGDRQKAVDYWHEASSKYPRTSYGKESLKRLL